MSTLITGVHRLAKALDVSHTTVYGWRRKGVLDAATVAEYGRIIIFDLEKVLQCLHHTKAKPGRPRNT